MAPNEYEIKKQICEIGKRIYNRNMVAANDGNISVKRARDRKLERAVSLISFVRQNRNNFKNILRIYSMTNDIFSHQIADPYFTCRNRHTISFWHRQRLFQVGHYFTLQSYNVKQESLF